MSTSTPVRMRNGASSSLSSATTSSCSRSRSAVRPLRDLQARRVVGEREVLVAEVARLVGHRADRVAAVGPVGVRVQVALELRARSASPVVGARARRRASSSLARYAGVSPVERLGDDRRGLVADARDVLEPAVRRRGTQLRLGHARRSRAPRAGTPARGTTGSPPRIEQLGDALERLDRRHAPTVPVGARVGPLVYSRSRRADRVAEGARLLSE